MAKQGTQMQMPGVFGGLMRYDSEYKSRFMISPVAVIAFVVGILVFVLLLRVFFPFVPGVGGGGSVPLPAGHGGFSWVLFNFLGILF